ncbi:LasR-specific antiactivator QslA [Pseudomonas zeae]|uniref:LasR-specific antiactivator QslA n=1 Tax=Pseudomonas TaxID=286 RepID=UPI0021496804|nr:LasR-specific antiactivator QslA [Pseudomonas zeae]UUT13513.1 LasR-specific antiactivator QslA [Pseudomonas zeae]
MFELSLLIGLPKPNSIDPASLTTEDATIKLRQAATLRLNRAQSILPHFPQDVELAVVLLDDAAELFDKAFRYLSGIPAQRVHQQIGEYVSVPSAEGCAGIRTLWNDEFRPMIEEGVRCGETWLDGSSLPLWWVLAQNGKHHHPGDPQEAFEAGFLLRLQQTLIMRREADTSLSTSFDA